MAKKIESIEATIAAPTGGAGSNTVFAQLGQATTDIGNLLAGNLANQAIEYSAIQGAQDAGNDNAPKTLMPGVTKATAAYNRAVIDTETRRLATIGSEQLAQAYLQHSNEGTLNGESSGTFNASANGIMQGILESARPEARAQVQGAMLEASSRLRSKMYGDTIDFNNKQIKVQFKNELDNAQDAYNEALLTKDKAAIDLTRSDIEKIVQDYSEINQAIKTGAPELLKNINNTAKIASIQGDFLEAQASGNGDDFIVNFVQNTQPELTVEEKYTALNKIMSLNSQVEGAMSQRRATAKQTLANDIDNPLSETPITSIEDLKDRPDYSILTPLQQEQVFSHLIGAQSAALKKQAVAANALKEISIGRAASIDKATINDLFTSSREQAEQQMGRPLNLTEQYAIVQGLDTNVPTFDKLLDSKLTSMDAQDALEAGRLYSTLRLAKQTNKLNLSGDAAIVAEKMATLLNGTATPQDETVKSIMNQVVNRTDPQVVERNDAANKVWTKRGPSLYKSAFGQAPDPFSDGGAYEVFKQKFFAAYTGSATEDEAMRIAQDGMRDWGGDPYFIPGNVGRSPPTKSLPLAQGTQVVRNQIIVGLSSIMSVNNEGLDPSKGVQPMRFTKDITIPENMSQEDFVYKSLGSDIFPVETVPLGGRANTSSSPTAPVSVMVDGVESNVALVSVPSTNASGEGLVYGVFAQDKFGTYQQLKDPRNDDGLAYIVLNDVDKMAPELFNNEDDARLRDTFESTRKNQMQQALKDEMYDAVFGSGPIGRTAKKGLEAFPVTRGIVNVGTAVAVRNKGKSDLSIQELKAEIQSGKSGKPKSDDDDNSSGNPPPAAGAMSSIPIADKIKHIAPKAVPEIAGLIDMDVLAANGIDTPAAVNAFIATLAHETAGFTTMTENVSSKQAANYGRRPDIGTRYIGRGLIQLTGKKNYEAYGKAIGVDLVNNPELAADPRYALPIAIKFWNDRGLSNAAKAGDMRKITKRVQGGDGGLAERVKFFNALQGLEEPK